MDINIFQQPKQLSAEERDVFMNAFEDVYVSSADREKVFQSLLEFFIPFEDEKAKQYYDTYWVWFVRCAWSELVLTPQEKFPELVWSTLPTALLFDIDLEGEMFYYFMRVCQTDQEKKTVFANAMQTLKQSSVPLNLFAPNSKTLGQLQEEVVRLKENERNSSLQTAEFYSVIEREYLTDAVIKIVNQDINKQEIVNRLVEFLYFFSKETDIVSVTARYFATLYDELEEQSGGPKIPEARAPYGAIKDALQELKIESEGELVGRLAKLADEYNDPHILDLYFFNEATGQFEWNEELLKEDSETT